MSVLVAVVLGGGTVASAQDTGSIPAAGKTGAGPLPAAAPRSGATAGSFRLYPRLAATLQRDDNIFSTEADPIRDDIQIHSPSLLAESDWTTHMLRVQVGADIARYARRDSEDYQDFGAGAEGRFDLDGGSNVYAGARYNREHENRFSPDNQIGLFPTRFEDVRANLGTYQQLDGWSYEVVGKLRQMDFENVPSTADPIFNDDRDRDMYTAGARVSRELDGGRTVFVQGTYDKRDYRLRADELGFRRDSDGYRLAVGTTFRRTGKGAAEGYVGYLRQSYGDPILPDVSALAIGLDGFWRLRDTTNLIAYAARTVEETTIAGAAAALDSAISVTLEETLRPRLTLILPVWFVHSDFRGTTRDDDIVGLGASLRYVFSDDASAELGYRYLERSSNAAGEDFEKNQVFVRVTGQLPALEGPPPVSLGDASRWYAEVAGGLAVPIHAGALSPALLTVPQLGGGDGGGGGQRGRDTFFPVDELGLDDGVRGSIAIGRKFDEGLRLELAGSHVEYDLDRTTFEVIGTIVEDDDARLRLRTAGELRVWTAMINGYYDLDTRSRWTPYVGAGLGAAGYRLSAVVNDAFPIAGRDTVFAYQAMAGLRYAVSERLTARAGYRFTGNTDPDVSVTAAAGRGMRQPPIDEPLALRSDAHVAEVGLAYAFGDTPVPPGRGARRRGTRYLELGGGLTALQDARLSSPDRLDITRAGVGNVEPPGAGFGGLFFFEELQFDGGGHGSVAIGREHGDGIRSEIQLSLRRAETDDATFGRTSVIFNIAGADLTAPSVGRVATHAVMGNVYWDPFTVSRWSPYFGAGLGVASMDVEATINDAIHVEGSETVFAWQGGMGVRYRATDDAQVRAGYRYFATAAAAFRGVDALRGTVGPLEIDDRTHNLELAVAIALH